MIIHGVQISGKSVLAPMAGITDNAFRLTAKSMGASLVFTEVVSGDGLVHNSLKSHRFIEFQPEERPIGIQLFGSDPDVLARAAQIVDKVRPDFIDLNFGCPAKKVVKSGAGAALLNNLLRMRTIVRAVVNATSVPVSAKIRIGWDEKNLVAVKASQILEEEGVCWITVHGRTKKMGFKGRANWNIIREVKESVSIPVIGNGDVQSPQDAKRMMNETGCDLVMIGRGALGRPWIFERTNRYLETGEMVEEPAYNKRIEICLCHYDLALGMLGIERGVKEMRKHIGWYLKGMPGSVRIRTNIFTMTNPGEVKIELRSYANDIKKFIE